MHLEIASTFALYKNNSRHPNRRQTDTIKFVPNSGGGASACLLKQTWLETKIGEYPAARQGNIPHIILLKFLLHPVGGCY
jgi:hypothetical protein